MLNRVLRAGLRASQRRTTAQHKQATFAMGAPRIDLEKALTLAAALEDEESVRELALRK